MTATSPDDKELEKFWAFCQTFGKPTKLNDERGALGEPSPFLLGEGASGHMAFLRLFWPLRILDEMYTKTQKEPKGD